MNSLFATIVSSVKRAAVIVADVVSKFIDDMTDFMFYTKGNTTACIKGEFGSIGYLNLAFLLLALVTLGPVELFGIFLLGAAGYATFFLVARVLANNSMASSQATTE